MYKLESDLEKQGFHEKITDEVFDQARRNARQREQKALPMDGFIPIVKTGNVDTPAAVLTGMSPAEVKTKKAISLSDKQKKFACLLSPEKDRTIIEYSTIRGLANKIRDKDVYFKGSDYSRWLKECAKRNKINLNPKTDKWWIYETEKGNFTVSPPGRTRKK